MLTRMVSISWSCDPPASASQSAGITDVSHCARPNTFLFIPSYIVLWKISKLTEELEEPYSEYPNTHHLVSTINRFLKLGLTYSPIPLLIHKSIFFFSGMEGACHSKFQASVPTAPCHHSHSILFFLWPKNLCRPMTQIQNSIPKVVTETGLYPEVILGSISLESDFYINLE